MLSLLFLKLPHDFHLDMVELDESVVELDQVLFIVRLKE